MIDRELEQGPKAGRLWPAELEEYTDPGTGARVRQLTNHPGGDDLHLYFTANGWYDDGRRLLVRLEREGRRNLFSIDLETGALTQLTDLPRGVGGCTRVNERTNEVYFAYGFEGGRYDNDVVVGLDVVECSLRTVVEKPDGYDDYTFGVDDVLADDEGLLVSVGERTGGEGHAGIHETYPHSAIFAASIEGDDLELVHEEEYWISHVNASPTRPELFTYCHEGPWDHVDNRIHAANLETGETYSLREVDENTAAGHEYWLADCEHVGYHGWRGERNPDDCFFGTIRYDDTDRRETPIPVRRTHCHSITRERFVCDGDDSRVGYVLLFEWDEDDGEYRRPRKLATHAWGEGSPHPHSRLSPDGSTVVFDADRAGADGNVFLVDVPHDVDALPVYRER